MDLFFHKTKFMQQMMRDVINGNNLYVQGIITTEKKLNSLHLKFLEKYQINLSRQQAYRRRLKSECTSKLHIFFDKKNNNYHWILMVSKIGEGIVKELEKLKDATNSKSKIIFDCYELGRFPIKGKKTSWTWKYKKGYIDNIKLEITEIIEQNNQELLKSIVYKLRKTMPFACARRQAFQINQFIKASLIEKKISPTPEFLNTFYIGYTRLI